MDTFEWTEEIPVTANNLNEMQNILNNNIKPKLLWENEDPTSTFSSQDITLSDDNYDYLEVYFYDWATNRNEKCVKVEKGKNILLDCIFYNNNNEFYLTSRFMTYVSDTQYSISNSKSLYGKTSVQVADPINFTCIPIKILGYKYS